MSGERGKGREGGEATRLGERGACDRDDLRRGGAAEGGATLPGRLQEASPDPPRSHSCACVDDSL